MAEWVFVLYFLWNDGHIQVVRPDMPQNFTSYQECMGQRSMVYSHIQLREGEKSFTVGCERKRHETQ